MQLEYISNKYICQSNLTVESYLMPPSFHWARNIITYDWLVTGTGFSV